MTENNEILLAIHWDGYPECFGIELLQCKNYFDIFELGKKHSIKFISAKIKSYLQIDKQDNAVNSHYSPKESQYLDHPEWQYEKIGNVWMCRPVAGFWPDSHPKDEYKPITICIYHLDKEKGRDRPFEKRGFKIVSNGSSLYDADFLQNFISNASDNLYAFSNQMTSALLFASAMGLTSFFYGPEFIINCPDPHWQHLDINKVYRTWEDKYRRYFRFPDCNIFEQQEIVTRELGKDIMVSPFEMHKILWKRFLFREYITRLTRHVRSFCCRMGVNPPKRGQ